MREPKQGEREQRQLIPKLVREGFAWVYLTKHSRESFELIELFDRKEINVLVRKGDGSWLLCINTIRGVLLQEHHYTMYFTICGWVYQIKDGFYRWLQRQMETKIPKTAVSWLVYRVMHQQPLYLSCQIYWTDILHTWSDFHVDYWEMIYDCAKSIMNQ